MAEFVFKKNGVYLGKEYTITIIPQLDDYPSTLNNHVYEITIGGGVKVSNNLSTTDLLSNLYLLDKAAERAIEVYCFEKDLDSPLRRALIEQGYTPELVQQA